MKQHIRVLHTADWHIGLESWKTDTPTDRTNEIKEALQFILQYGQDNDIDLIVISGDITEHRTSPSAIEHEIVLHYLNEFSAIAPVIFVTGNHDWVGLPQLDVFSQKTNIHLINRFYGPDGSPSSRILYIKGQKVKVFGLPYFDIRNLIKKYTDKISDTSRDILKEHLHKINEACDPDAWNILAAHITIEGIKYTNYAEEPIDFSINPQLLPNLVDYIALGHIHSQTFVSSAPTETWYSGAIIKNDFGEESNKVGFLIIDLEEGKNPQVQPIETPHKGLKTIEVSLNSGMENCLKEIEEKSYQTPEDYIRVILRAKHIEDLPPLWMSRIKNVSKKIVKINVEVAESEHSVDISDIEEKAKDMKELFKEYIEKTENLNEDEKIEMIEYFTSIFKEVKENEA